MTEVITVKPGQFRFCSSCLDIYGVAEGEIKVCHCARSADLASQKAARPKRQMQPDFDTPFEICYYCQATIVRSGSRWSTFYCELCRPSVLEINQARDEKGLSVLPIGRHSLQHANWHHVAPSEPLDNWRRENLQYYWAEFEAAGAEPDDWAGFAASIERTKQGSRYRNLDQLLEAIDATPPDRLFELLRKAND